MIAVVLAATLVGSGTLTGPKIQVTFTSGKSFVIQTDAKGSPLTTKHIVELVKKKFYDGIKFHRVEDWVVQWGDPASKKGLNGNIGNGGSGKPVKFEAGKISFLRGAVGMASTGSKVGGDSQIFVVRKDSSFLDGNYAILGQVVSGMDVIDKIATGDTIKSMIVMGVKSVKKPIKK